MKKFRNSVRIEGYFYQHKLELRKSGAQSKAPGTEYIAGSLDIATDEACTNVVTVRFSYVTAVTKSGKANDTFNVLKNIINGVYKSVMDHGKENASKFRIDSVVGLNEFYDRNDQFVSVKMNDGGFVHTTNELNPDEKQRSKFDCDMIITGFRRIEATETKPEKGIVKGAIFNFMGALLPVEFSVTHAGAMDYFEGLEATSKNPVVTQVRGNMISKTVITKDIKESAFGEAEVIERRNTEKDYVITWAAAETQEWDSEETITAKELTEAMAARETYLATIKQRNDEYKASKGNGAASAGAPASGGFNF